MVELEFYAPLIIFDESIHQKWNNCVENFAS